MNKILWLLALFTFATAGSLYYQHHNLQSALAANKENCSLDVAELERNYKAKVAEMLARLPEGIEIKKTIAATLETPKIERMVSYGHKVQAVTTKYEFILETAEIAAEDKETLRRLLMQREQLAASLDQAANNSDVLAQKKQLDTIEEKIRELLKDPVDYTRFEYLKERSL